jgi:diaminopimelate decarboxylase
MFISNQQAHELVQSHGSPLFVYSSALLQARATELQNLELPYGHTIRYAVKANPHPGVIGEFMQAGLHFDASSSFEASELLARGVAGEKISLSSQQPAHNLPELLAQGVKYVATSQHQLQLFADATTVGAKVALRVNPGLGAGHNNRTSTGGSASSFGLWHEYLEDARALARDNQIVIDRVHMHIGSGADPSVWGQAMDTALSIVRRMPDVTTLDIGGGYKVARTDNEQESDMSAIAKVFSERLRAFADATGRELHLEIEPGTWLVAHAGILLTRIVDIVDTGRTGFTFLRVDTGMNDIIRPSMYGAQHDIISLSASSAQKEYVVVGHNCETGDIITPAPGNPEAIAPRSLNTVAIGDLLAIKDTGAYCASFSTKGYNAFPSAHEIFV